MNQVKRGYLYIAIGEKYIEEAITSARSLKNVVENPQVTLVSDREIETDVFDTIVIDPCQVTNWRDGLSYKVKHMYKSSPYEQTFFVDSDTYFYESCEALFDLLEYFDLCMSMAHGDTNVPIMDGKCLTSCHPYNTGIILFRKNSINKTLFQDWKMIYNNNLKIKNFRYKESDQTAFIEALLKSKSRIYLLPDIWNARTTCYLSLQGTVKVVHGRHKDYEQLRNIINSSSRMRGWDPNTKRCYYYNQPLWIVNFRQFVKKHFPLIQKIYKKFFITFENRGVSNS